jgi:hypothetical protein
MRDAIEERDDNRAAKAIRRRKLERCFELRRFRRDPENVDVVVERRRGRHTHLELAECDALDA